MLPRNRAQFEAPVADWRFRPSPSETRLPRHNAAFIASPSPTTHDDDGEGRGWSKGWLPLPVRRRQLVLPS